MKPKSVLIEKNKEYVSVMYLHYGMAWITEPNQDIQFYPPDISNIELGMIIKYKLSLSREIGLAEFHKIFNSEEFKSLSKRTEQMLKDIFGYKTKKAIYKNMLFVSVYMNEHSINITPHHQDSLGGYTSVKSTDGKVIEFKYPLLLSDEELGKAVMNAFEYCTSIYRK
ncbi:contact-dependent growth inhibition system immunity protein [Mannheimia massilioguelmaensis]|uniref:contact-dependent growth inhibition system immunity protein n=1 Tax=Mannheimia massilioguelmaensis TaxID=1604354 RepID=UPI0005C88538|nr:contact-dependent growth inhibition system immunity protein [Mannheimia massilioguelmaensis]